MQYQGNAVLVDVKTSLPYGKRAEITSGLNKLEGIRSADFSQHVDRVMIVSYDPATISAQSIRSNVQGYLETDGPATCLIGI